MAVEKIIDWNHDYKKQYDKLLKKIITYTKS